MPSLPSFRAGSCRPVRAAWSLGLAALLSVPFALPAPLAAQSVPGGGLPTSPAGVVAPSGGILGIPGLRQGVTVSLDIHGEPGAPIVAVPQFGIPFLFDLRPHSVRAPGYQVLEQRDDGSVVPVPFGPVRTYRGSVMGFAGSVVAGGLHSDGLYLRVILGNGEEYALQPVPSAATAAGGLHVLYRPDDVLDGRELCGTDTLPHGGFVKQPRVKGSGGAPTEAAGSIAEIAFDADYEYFLDWGSTGNVEARINTVVNTVNVQYERDVDIEHQITTILVRTSSNQPYTSSDATQLLYSFRNEWNANRGGIQRDVAHLMTGKSINGGTIGIAWIGAICTSYGYGLSESDFNGVYSSATDLTAHELGHNWNAPHCSCTSYTMNPYITSSNRFRPTDTIPTIASFRNSRSCLDAGGGGGGGATPTSLHVQTIVPDLVNQGRGQKAGEVTVQIVDDLGNPVSGVTVSGTFSGDFSQNRSGTTNGSGVVVLTTTTTIKGRASFSFCVTSANGGLPYEPADNVESCDGL